MNWRHLVFLLALAGCAWIAYRWSSPTPPTPSLLAPWTIADLAGLDPADAPQPALDLAAAYLRREGSGLQIRLDLLEHDALPAYDLLIALDGQPGGTRRLPIDAEADLLWDQLLVIPADGKLQLLDAGFNPLPAAGFLAIRDPLLDQVSISLNLPQPPQRLPRLQAFITPAGGGQIADRTAPASRGAAAIRPARVLAAFANTYPAYTPATALRRWSGAHTGPLGGSHGLSNLLQAAAEHQTPLLLADLARPEAAAALDVVGALPFVRQMAADGMLILPPWLPVLQDGPHSREARLELGRRQQLWLTGFDLQPTAAVQIDESSLARHDPYEAALDGPSPAVRRALLDAAVQANLPGGSDPVILGGELPNSTWGIPQAARATLRYLSSRPWIHFISPADLYALPGGERNGGVFSAPAALAYGPALPTGESEEIQRALLEAPPNALTDAAWQAYAGLHAPVYPHSPGLPGLRAKYIEVVWSLLAASRWADRPAGIRSCELDPDHDGESECVLANRSLYAVFELPGGALTHLFSRDASGSHQWIAPSAQMITGLSDPALWNLENGFFADPSVLPGAFYDFSGPEATVAGFDHSLTDAGIRFDYTLASGSARRTFSLGESGLKVDTTFSGSPPYAGIPLSFAPDAWLRFTPGWAAGYRWSRGERSVSISPPGEPGSRLQITSSTPLSVQAFSDTLQFLDRPENPDRDLPPGHYLPFPLFRIEIPTSGESQVIIEVRPGGPSGE